MGRPGVLPFSALGGRTGKDEALESELSRLKAAGVGALVSLTEDALPEESVRAAGLDYLHLPVPDMAPPTGEDVERFVAFVEASVGARRPVAVHCTVGRGRTGTMLACYLVKRGAGPGEAIQRVRKDRPGSIETHEQEDAVFAYSRHLEERGP
jgi:atypical dual specificity phosphatase